MTKAEPSFLRARAMRAKEQAAATVATPAQPTPPQTASAAPAPNTSRPATPRKPQRTSAAAKKPEGAGKGRRNQRVAEGGGGAQQSVSDVDALSLDKLLLSYASRPELVGMLQAGDMQAVVETMVAGAKLKGAVGVADRAMLWRMLGMPWMKQEGSGATLLAGVQLGARLGTAVARLEGTGRRGDVTLDSAEVREVAESLAALGGAHMFEQQAPASEVAPEAGKAPAQAAPEAAPAGRGADEPMPPPDPPPPWRTRDD